MFYEFYAQTDAGLVRTNNEDCTSFDAGTGVCLVADGMGGYKAGEVASGMAVSLIKSEMMRWLTQTGDRAGPQAVRRALEICVENTNLSILKAANDNSKFAGMGTTLVAAVFLRDKLVLGHIGDSRCYRFRAGQLQQLTRDHSLLQEQIDAGLITAEEAANSSQRNLVTRALGVEPDVELEVTDHEIQPEDIFLMCTDGLTDMVDDNELAIVLHANVSLDVTAQKLVDTANIRGGRDNIGILLANAKVDPKKTTIMARLLGR